MKTQWLNESGILLFGKYKADDIYDVADEDPTYVQWMLDELKLTDEEHEYCENALEERNKNG
jgi:hypothetical protein